MNVPKPARFCVAVILCVGPAMLTAQAVPIPLGARVRVEMRDKTRFDGTLMSQSADSVAVASPKAIRTAVATGDISRVRRSEGKSRGHGAVKGLKVGAVIVGGVGALVVAGGSNVNDNVAQAAVFGAVGGAIAGALYGAVIGAIVGAEKWTTVYTIPARLSFVPAPTGAPGIAVTFRF